ncbi:hypothetical protein [Pseudomonas oryziphila]|uniref:Uncharacterized protein n=1 Tax=Pseudomonas entomophila TaxID=312306 RepID=A0A3Q8U1G4_9PSED|nr:hypothetical protein [Pseudomonas oryziphila]AZL69194.1 hypothetical protein EJA05_16325 [Pseudomonas oryziphila]
MPAGFEVVNNDGVLQVTENYSNYIYAGKQTITGVWINAWPEQAYFYTVTIPVGWVVAFRGIGVDVGLYSASVSGNNIVYRFFTPQSGLGTPGSASPQCVFYKFSVNIQPDPATYGLEVYTASGVLAFSSNGKYMKPVGAWSGQNFLAEAQQAPNRRRVLESYSANRAVFVGGPVGYQLNEPFTFNGLQWWSRQWVYYLVIGNYGGNLTFTDGFSGMRELGPSNVQIPYRYAAFNQYYIMTIDVTNY